LFREYRPIAALEMHHRENGVNLHFTGMWVGFAVAEREQSLLQMQEELARKDRLASLVTLAAGAAHELSTPLSTIAIVAKELEHYATRTVLDTAVADDSRLIRMEVDRCRQILHRMSSEGAEPAGEPRESVPLRRFTFSPPSRHCRSPRQTKPKPPSSPSRRMPQSKRLSRL
jgi:two-component system sensor histidine kinase RegB